MQQSKQIAKMITKTDSFSKLLKTIDILDYILSLLYFILSTKMYLQWKIGFNIQLKRLQIRLQLIMARANGYIIAKQFQKQGDNLEVSFDISPDNRLIVFGIGPIIKLVSMKTQNNYWFDDRKTLGKQMINCKASKQKVNIPNNLRVVRDVKWNCCQSAKNLIGVAMGQSAVVYDVEDMQASKTPQGFLKVFETDQIMRKGDYPSKFVWYPDSKDIFLCTSNKVNQIVVRDLRVENTVLKFNGYSFDDKNQCKIDDLKFNPVNSNIFATISKQSTIEIFDYRKPSKSIFKKQSAIQNYKSNLLDWQYTGNRLASAFGNWINIWGFDGQQLIQKQSWEHKNIISDFKWLRKHSDHIFVSEMHENIVYGYRISKQIHDIQVLVDPRHSGLKKFITDRNQSLILGITNFEDSRKHQHEMIAVFIDDKSSQSIWSKTKHTKPNCFGLDNQLLFSVSKKDHRGIVEMSYALMFQQMQSSAKKIHKQLNQIEKEAQIEKRRSYQNKKLVQKLKHKGINTQRKQLKKQVKQKNIFEHSNNQQIDFEDNNSNGKNLSDSKIRKIKKSNSIEQKQIKQSSKNYKSLQKSQKLGLQKKSNKSFSSSSEQIEGMSPQKDQWLLSYCEQVQYLDKNYRIQINEQINEQKGQNICKHNSKVAMSIGKTRCAQFWKYLYYLAFPETEQKYNLSSLYEDKVSIDVYFKENKIIANCQSKSQMSKKIIKYNMEKLIQSLVDENQLQTAVMASIFIRNKDEKMLSLEFIQPFLVCYKQLLKAMGLTFISTNLSFAAKLNQAVPSTIYNFYIPIGCGQCHKKFSDKKCTCLQVCIFCGDPLVSSLVIGCKICGHMAHARQYEKWFKSDEAGQKCPYRECQHECFKG